MTRRRGGVLRRKGDRPRRPRARGQAAWARRPRAGADVVTTLVVLLARLLRCVLIRLITQPHARGGHVQHQLQGRRRERLPARAHH